MPKPDNSHISHDVFMKKILSDKLAAISFMRTFLPPDLADELDIEAFEYVSGTFINEELGERFADLLLTVPTKQKTEIVTVAILIELKSRKEKYTALQIMEYLALGYKKQRAKGEKLRLIVPLIYYHGIERWEYENLDSYFAEYPASMRRYIPQWASIFIDLKEKSATEIEQIEDELLQTAIRIQWMRFMKKVDSVTLVELFEYMNTERVGNHLRGILVYAFKYLEITSEYNNFIERIPEPIKIEAMTIYSRWIAEGRAEGKAEGIEQGIEQKAIEVVLQCHKNGISIPMIVNITGLTESEVKKILAEQKR